MARTSDALRQFVALRSALEQERAALHERLREIETVIGSGAGAALAAPRRGRPPGRPSLSAPARRGPGRRPAGAIGMRDAIAQVVSRSPMKIREIVEGMQRIGFVFKSKNPVNSVGAYLYGPEGKKYFRRVDGKFTTK